MIHDLTLDSRGHCFLCLEQILKVNLEKDDSAPPTPLHSLQDLSHYLEMELGRVLNEKEEIPQDLLTKLEDSRLKVPLCEECVSLNDKFSELFQQLEKINLEAVSCIKRIHDQLSGAVKTGRYKRFRTSFTPESVEGDAGNGLMIGKLKIVNLMRIEAMRKSARCLYKAKRQIKLQKPTAKTNIKWLTPQPVSSTNQSTCDDGPNSEDFDGVEMKTLEDGDCNMESNQGYDIDVIEDVQHQSAEVEERKAIDVDGSPMQVVISRSNVDLRRTLNISSVQIATAEEHSSLEIREPQFGPSQTKPAVALNMANMDAVEAREKIKIENPSEPNFSFHSGNEDSYCSSENELIIDEEMDNPPDRSPMQFNDDQSLPLNHQFSDSDSIPGPTIIKIQSVNGLDAKVPFNSRAGDEDVNMSDENGKPQGSVNSDKGNYQCSICSMEFISRSGLQSHSRSVHLKVRYQCEPCNKEFVGSGSYRRHYRSVHMGVRYACGVCGKTYSQICHLKYHKRTSCVTETQNPGFPCRLCGKVLAAANVLQRHVKTVHLNLREHACTICGRTYHLNCQLQQHLQKVHAVLPDETSETSLLLGN